MAGWAVRYEVHDTSERVPTGYFVTRGEENWYFLCPGRRLQPFGFRAVEGRAVEFLKNNAWFEE